MWKYIYIYFLGDVGWLHLQGSQSKRKWFELHDKGILCVCVCCVMCVLDIITSRL